MRELHEKRRHLLTTRYLVQLSTLDPTCHTVTLRTLGAGMELTFFLETGDAWGEMYTLNKMDLALLREVSDALFFPHDYFCSDCRDPSKADEKGRCEHEKKVYGCWSYDNCLLPKPWPSVLADPIEPFIERVRREESAKFPRLERRAMP